MQAALYVSTGNELPPEFRYGGTCNNSFISDWEGGITDILTEEYGLSRRQLEDLVEAGDRVIPIRYAGPVDIDEYVDDKNWPETAIVESILARIDEMEAAETAAYHDPQELKTEGVPR